MKTISAQSTSGPEGAGVSVLAWFLSTANLDERVRAWLEGKEPAFITDRTDRGCGARVLEELPLEEELWAAVAGDPGIAFVVQYALGSRGRDYFRRDLETEAGLALKRTGWFDRNEAAVRREKDKLKAVRKVMES